MKFLPSFTAQWRRSLIPAGYHPVRHTSGFRLLPVASLPQVDFPVIMVSASLPGASPETMASSVATAGALPGADCRGQ